MQAFLPHPSFTDSAAALDNARLNKQIMECDQIIAGYCDPDRGYRSHPVAHMWRDYPAAFLAYREACICEAERRGIDVGYATRYRVPDRYDLPPFVGDGSYHYAHRARLLEKMPSWYSRFEWHVSPLPNGAKIRAALYDGWCKSAHGGAWRLG
jgi:hypothetical protein